MWLSRLDLVAYGHFSNVELNLGPGFHLVYGLNEAGKSTTLRAIRQLLFGFDERTKDNFLHKNANLRIGATICANDGSKLQVIRRKTRKDSLRGPDDIAVIDDIQWQNVLSGIDESTFSRRYGIDYEQLIEGGHEIATGTGDLGEILFATASGIKDLSTVQKGFDQVADDLFRQRGEKQRINAALNELKKQRDQVAEKLVLITEWEEIDRQWQQAQSERNDISSKLENHLKERDRLESWKLAWPHIQDHELVKQQLTALASTPRLDEKFGAMRQEALTLLSQANSVEGRANVELSRARQFLDKINLPQILLAGADELAGLLTESGSHSKAQLDRQGLVEQIRQQTELCAALQQQLGRAGQDAVRQDNILQYSLRSKVGQLGREHAGLVQTLEQAKQQQLRVHLRINEAQSELAATPEREPLNDLREIIRKARNDGDLVEQYQRLTGELEFAQSDLDRQIEQIGLWTGSVTDLISMRIPTTTAIANFEQQFEANQSEQSVLRARLSELEDRNGKLDRQIEILRKQFQVPTEDELSAARKHRDHLWSLIRNSDTSRSRPATELIESFEHAMIESDRIADRLRSEADRAAQLSDQIQEVHENENLQHEISVRLAELEAIRLAQENDWQAIWPQLNVASLRPREMLAWLARREKLVECDKHLSRRKDEAKTVRERINQHLSKLTNRIGELGVHKDDLAGQLEVAERLLNDHDLNRKLRGETEKQLATLKLEESETGSTVIRLTAELDEWHTAWRSAMDELNLPHDTSVESTDVYLQTLGELSEVQKQIAQLSKRVADIDQDAAQFRLKVKSVCQRLAPDLVESTTDEAVKSLRVLLSNSQRDQATFQEHSVRKENAEKQIGQALEARARGIAILTELHRAVGLSNEVIESMDFQSESSIDLVFRNLAEAEQKSRQHLVLEEKLNRSNERLQGLARELPVAEFILQARQQSEEKIVDQLRLVESEIPQLEVRRQTIVDRMAEIQAEMKRMDGRADAAEAEEKQQFTLAQIRSDSELYLRAKLAGAILNSAIEKYREKSRGPVLKSASELFRELTLGRFEGLRVEEDDHGNPLLVGVRPNTLEAVHVDGMSEGTCDQLYLALRLASLEMETAPRNQLPLIVDDILIQFDDERAAAALRILARVARQRQVIFFTHHERLLEIANQHLDAKFTTHRLNA